MGRKAIALVATTQDLQTNDANIRGTIADSNPVYGRSERSKYPNWAAKSLLDALLAPEKVQPEDETDAAVD